MRKKRVTALLLAMSMVISVFLTGCGKTEEKSTESKSSASSSVADSAESSQATASSEEVKELDPVTLKFWLPVAKTEDSDQVVDLVNEHLKEVLPNTTVEIEWIAISEYKDRFGKAMAAREVIDLAWFGYANNKIETEISNGSLMPIDDLLKEYGSGISETLGEDVVELHRSLDGNLYFVPAWQGIITNRYAMYVPHDIVELMGDGWAEEFQAALYENWEKPFWDVDSKMVFPTYVEELLAAAKKANMLNLGFYIRMNPVQYYFMSNSVSSEARSESVAANINVYAEGDTFYVQAGSALESPEYYQIQVFSDWYKKGYIREDVLSAKLGNVKWKTSLAREQTYVNYFHNGWTDQEADSYTATAGFQVDGFFFQETPEIGDGFDSGAVIPSTSANPERAMMFLELLYTDVDLYHLLVDGVEGKHYTKNADGTITNVENKTYTGPNNWMVGTCMNSYQTDATLMDKYQNLKDAESYARRSPLEGFIFDPEPVSIEISNIAAVVKEYSVQSMLVQDDWEGAFTARRDKMIAAGIETLLKEYCDQLSVYAAEKGMKVENMGY